jgi:hypothetical protein
VLYHTGGKLFIESVTSRGCTLLLSDVHLLVGSQILQISGMCSN